MIKETAMSITEALLGMDTVTRETPEEVSHMMATGESQLEARGRKVSSANPKRTFRIGCSNVRTMFAGGRTAMVVNEMRRYKLSILSVSEVRWLGFGRVRTSKGEVILYSGAEEIHHRGVGIILNRMTWL